MGSPTESTEKSKMEPRVPDEFSLLYYGNRDLFAKKLEEGYTEAAGGIGEWVGNDRIVRLWVLYGSDKPIFTYQHPKCMPFMSSAMTMHGTPFEQEFATEEEFAAYVEKKKITLWPRTNLKQLLEGWAVSSPKS